MVLPGSTFPTFLHLLLLKRKLRKALKEKVKTKVTGWTYYYYEVVKSFFESSFVF